MPLRYLPLRHYYYLIRHYYYWLLILILRWYFHYYYHFAMMPLFYAIAIIIIDITPLYYAIIIISLSLRFHLPIIVYLLHYYDIDYYYMMPLLLLLCRRLFSHYLLLRLYWLFHYADAIISLRGDITCRFLCRHYAELSLSFMSFRHYAMMMTLISFAFLLSDAVLFSMPMLMLIISPLLPLADADAMLMSCCRYAELMLSPPVDTPLMMPYAFAATPDDYFQLLRLLITLMLMPLMLSMMPPPITLMMLPLFWYYYAFSCRLRRHCCLLIFCAAIFELPRCATPLRDAIIIMMPDITLMPLLRYTLMLMPIFSLRHYTPLRCHYYYYYCLRYCHAMKDILRRRYAITPPAIILFSLMPFSYAIYAAIIAAIAYYYAMPLMLPQRHDMLYYIIDAAMPAMLLRWYCHAIIFALMLMAPWHYYAMLTLLI